MCITYKGGEIFHISVWENDSEYMQSSPVGVHKGTFLSVHKETIAHYIWFLLESFQLFVSPFSWSKI